MSTESTYRKNAKKLIDEATVNAEKNLEEQYAEIDRVADERIASAETAAVEGKVAADEAYRDVVDTAAVQRELDRRQIQETMANMGLSRSGLNATQQTAVQLSAGNKQAAAAIQRQAAVDSLTKALAEYKLSAEDERRSSKLSAKTESDKALAEYASELEQSVTKAESDDYKSALDASNEALKLQIKAAENEQERATKATQKVLDKMLENGQLSNDLYLLATSQGWSGDYLERVMRFADAVTPYELTEEEKKERNAAAIFKKMQPSMAELIDPIIAKLDAKTTPSIGNDKNATIAQIIANFPFPEGDGQDVNATARDYLFSKAGISQTDLNNFIAGNVNKTTE